MEDSQYFIVIALESILGGLEIYIDILLIFWSRNANMEKKAHKFILIWLKNSYWKHIFDTEVPLSYVYVEDLVWGSDLLSQHAGGNSLI